MSAGMEPGFEKRRRDARHRDQALSDSRKPVLDRPTLLPFIRRKDRTARNDRRFDRRYDPPHAHQTVFLPDNAQCFVSRPFSNQPIVTQHRERFARNNQLFIRRNDIKADPAVRS